MERVRQIAAHLNPHFAGLLGSMLNTSNASLDRVKYSAAQVDWLDALAQAMQYAKENPTKVCFKTLKVVVMLLPGLVAGPFLHALGFTRLGPAARSLASCVQSFMGNVAGGGIFACLQSAGMSGYGRVVVENGIRVVVFVLPAA